MAKSIEKSKSDKRGALRARRILSIQHRLFQSINSKELADGGQWSVSMTRDMSVGGIGFYSEEQYKEGDILELNVVMSGVLDVLKGYGRVVRAEEKTPFGYLTAIQFVEKIEDKQEAAKTKSVTKATAHPSRRM